MVHAFAGCSIADQGDALESVSTTSPPGADRYSHRDHAGNRTSSGSSRADFRDFHTLFAGAQQIFFPFDFQKGLTVAEVSAHAHFQAWSFPVVMIVVERKFRGVKIQRYDRC
jgi:hypothetical protein